MDLRRAVTLLERGDWKAAHEIVQADEDSAAACWAHGIVHVMEGDLPNARYWYGKAGRPFSEDVPGEIAALSASLGR
jgi:hypothetical protein